MRTLVIPWVFGATTAWQFAPLSSAAWPFVSTDISQSSVATHLRGGGIFYYRFTTYLLLSLWVEKIENRSAFGRVSGKNKVAPFFANCFD